MLARGSERYLVAAWKAYFVYRPSVGSVVVVDLLQLDGAMRLHADLSLDVFRVASLPARRICVHNIVLVYHVCVKMISN